MVNGTSWSWWQIVIIIGATVWIGFWMLDVRALLKAILDELRRKE